MVRKGVDIDFTIYQWFMPFQIIQLKKKLKEYEERKMDPLVPGGSNTINTISSQNQTEIHK